MSSEKKVVWLYTEGNVALVADLSPIRDGAVRHLPRHAVYAHKTARPIEC